MIRSTSPLLLLVPVLAATAAGAAPKPPASPRPPAAGAPAVKPLQFDFELVDAWVKAEKLSPVGDAPGLVVLDPVAAEAPLGDFGAGCGHWLAVTVAGHPELGRTPQLTSVDRLRRQMRKPSFRLALPDAVRLAKLAGATQVAVGEIKPVGDGCKLVYRLHQVSDSKVVGAPVVLSGTREEVAKNLPRAAEKLAALAGVAEPRVPAEQPLTPAELEVVGRALPDEDNVREPAAQARLDALAPRSPVAGVFALNAARLTLRQAWKDAVRRLLEQAPDNQLVWSAIAGRGAPSLLPYRKRLAELRARYPQSYALAHSETWLCRAAEEPEAELSAAQDAVRRAPHNSDAWLGLAATLSDAADRVRRARVFADLGPAEVEYLEIVYARWTMSTLMAVRQDHDYGKAWLRLATAATFVGDRELAELAYHNANLLVEEEHRGTLYSWGLEMFHPKWGGTPEQAQEVATAAAAHRFSSAQTGTAVADRLEMYEFKTEAARLRQALVTGAREAVRLHPESAARRWDLAMVLLRQRDSEGAESALREAVRLDPDVPGQLHALGELLMLRGEKEEALQLCRRAIELDPETPDYRLTIAYIFSRHRELKDAVEHGRETVKLYPRHWRARMALVGSLRLMGDLAAAEEQVRDFLRLQPDHYFATFELAQLQFEQQKYDAARKALRRCIELNKGDIHPSVQSLIDRLPK